MTFFHIVHPILQLILPSKLSRRELIFTTSTATILIQATNTCKSNLPSLKTKQNKTNLVSFLFPWPALVYSQFSSQNDLLQCRSHSCHSSTQNPPGAFQTKSSNFLQWHIKPAFLSDLIPISSLLIPLQPHCLPLVSWTHHAHLPLQSSPIPSTWNDQSQNQMTRYSWCNLLDHHI